MKIGDRQKRMLRILADDGGMMQLRQLATYFGGIVRAMQIAKSLEKRSLADRNFFSWSINDAGRTALEQEAPDARGVIEHVRGVED